MPLALTLAIVLTVAFPPLGLALIVVLLCVHFGGRRSHDSGTWRQRREADAWARQPAIWTPEEDRS